MALLVWAGGRPGLAAKWRRATWEKLAFCSRYGHVSPTEAACWELTDLNEYAEALGKIVEAENKAHKKPRRH